VRDLAAPARFDFDLPPELEAREPPEARGLARDRVRLMVTYRSSGRLVHATFRDLPQFLAPGDLLVINTSATLAASLPARTIDGTDLRLHLSTHLDGDRWLVELRTPAGASSGPFSEARVGMALSLPGGGSARLGRAFRREFDAHYSPRLWEADVQLPGLAADYLARHGLPIRYGYIEHEWPLAAFQTVYATEPGSAEMPSAGRAFTPELITRLVARGVTFAPLLLHTGVSSADAWEPPYPEWFRVPPATARLVNAASRWGGRVIAVGTTVVRALETVAGEDGTVEPREGWTDLEVTRARDLRAIDGLLTGWHQPEASHLHLLEAALGPELLSRSYRVALRRRYLWHEFGDLQLILP
jgi:S-adenosylmethionine:tRNA ribosyltransferase-isomerase